MKTRHIFLILGLFLTIQLAAQPPETTYLGTEAIKGYANDESYGPLDIGFNFTFFGNSYSQFYINSNGMILFGTGSFSPTEVSIPTTGVPNNFIAAFWDDLAIDPSGKILYTSFGAESNRKLVIQFKNMDFWNPLGYMGTFTVILYEGSNKIQVQYRLIVDNNSTRAHGDSATIGIENFNGSAGYQYSYHEASIVKEQAISFTPSTPASSIYTINSNATYDGVYLTTNVNLPEPGITSLISPPQDAVIGEDYTFQWGASSNATSYALRISNNSDLSGATVYAAGSNLNYAVTNLILDTTYYWGVFATNATGTTWCEIKKFTTNSDPPLVPVPQTIWTEQLQDKTITLQYTGGDGSPKTAIITSLPAQGKLFQYDAGERGDEISFIPPATIPVTDAGMKVIYAATGGTGNGVGNFNFMINDAGGDSPEGTITVNVSPPGVPNVLYFSKNANVEIQFDIQMSNPTGKQSQFTITANGSPVPITSASLKTGDPYTIVLTPGSALTAPVLISYTPGDITGSTGGYLLPFTDRSVTLTAQTITFNQSLETKFSDSPFTLTASASSGLGMTYSSTNLAVATASLSVLTFHALGTSNITARQAGNATYAPAKYIKPLTVAKGDQTITFSALPAKTLGDADFFPGATASSGLTVSYSSDNLDVATIVSGKIHITGAGSSLITASQSGNTLWNAATDVPQILTVNKKDQTITFNPIPDKIFGASDFDPGATASSGLTVSYVSDNTDVATIVGGMIHIVDVGCSVITASQAGDANYNAAIDVPQTLTVDVATGMENPTAQNMINIYSSDNQINIRIFADEWDGKTGSVRVVGMTGLTVKYLQPIEFRKNSIIEVGAPRSKGIYFVELKAGVLHWVGKVAVK